MQAPHPLGSHPHSFVFLRRLPGPTHLCHLLPFPHSTLLGHTLTSSMAESMSIAVCWVGSRGAEEGLEKERRRRRGGGRVLSNRIKGEQRNGVHLKYSWHEPCFKKEEMSNNDWITLEALSLHNLLSLLRFPSIFSFQPHFLTYWLRVFDGSQRRCGNNVRVALINQWREKNVFNSERMTKASTSLRWDRWEGRKTSRDSGRCSGVWKRNEQVESSSSHWLNPYMAIVGT